MYKRLLLTATISVFVLASVRNPIYAVAGQWSSSGSTIFYNDGNVGIGTSTPTAKLHSSGTSTNADTVVLNLSTISGRGWDFWAGKYAHPTKGDYSLTISQPLYSGCEACKGDLQFKPGRNTIFSDGNVGIGTSSPVSKLQISGPSNTAFTMNTGNNSNALIQSSANQIFRLDYDNNETNNYAAFQNHTGAFIMKVQDNGNVGIKTSNPTAELSVYGTVLAKQVIVSTAASYWPDYVFEKDYQLMPLAELSAYIKANKHLPGVPSASEVGATGQDLGEIQKQQMEKIEELTLYVIKLEERIAKLEAGK